MNEVKDLHVEDRFTDRVLSSFKKHKRNKNNLEDDLSVTSTHNGIQTKNTLELDDFLEDDDFQDALKVLLATAKLITGEELVIFWSHFVQYNRGGFQDRHRHDHNEDYSCIFYLNTCKAGETYFSDLDLSFSPKKGRFLIFPSSFRHGARETTSWFIKKKVLVLGLRKP